MKKLFLFLLFIAFNTGFLYSQDTLTTYVNNKNKAIELTNKAITSLENNKPAIAFNLLVKAIKVDKTHRGAYLQLYQVSLKSKTNLNKIADLLISGTSIFTTDDELYYYVGEIYRMKYDFKKAIRNYSLAIKYAKTNGEDFYLVPYYYFNRANSYLKTVEYKKAISDYDYALTLSPTFYACISNKGISLYQLGKKEEACKCWKEGSEKGQDASRTYYNENCK